MLHKKRLDKLYQWQICNWLIRVITVLERLIACILNSKGIKCKIFQFVLKKKKFWEVDFNLLMGFCRPSELWPSLPQAVFHPPHETITRFPKNQLYLPFLNRLYKKKSESQKSKQSIVPNFGYQIDGFGTFLHFDAPFASFLKSFNSISNSLSSNSISKFNIER